MCVTFMVQGWVLGAACWLWQPRLEDDKISKILFSSLEIGAKAKASHVAYAKGAHTKHCCWAHLPAHRSLGIRAPGSKGEPWQPDGNVFGARTSSRSSKSFVSIRLIMRGDTPAYRWYSIRFPLCERPMRVQHHAASGNTHSRRHGTRHRFCVKNNAAAGGTAVQ